MTTPLLSPEQATKFLDEIIYERVFACIDVVALFELEQLLNLALYECGLGDDAVIEIADQMIAQALARAASDQRRWVNFSPDDLDDDCALCQQVAHDVAAEDKRERASRAERAGRRRKAS